MEFYNIDFNERYSRGDIIVIDTYGLLVKIDGNKVMVEKRDCGNDSALKISMRGHDTDVEIIAAVSISGDVNDPIIKLTSTNPTYLRINNNGTVVGDRRIIDTFNIRSLYIPSVLNGISVTGIGENAFSKCKSLTNVVIDHGAIYIENNAFYECENIVSVNLPDTISYIGDMAFSECETLSEINLPDNIVKIGRNAFRHTDLMSIKMPKSLRTLGLCCFADTRHLVSVDFAESDIDIIPSSCFYNSGVRMVALNDNVRIVEDRAFANCTKLANIALPNSIIAMHSMTFTNCTELLTSMSDVGIDDIYVMG